MFHRILVPLDGSPVAEQVLPLTKMLVVRFSSLVVLFQAIQPMSKKEAAPTTGSQADDQLELWRRQALEYLEGVAQGFPHGVPVQHEVRVGLPATAILEFAESAHIDLIAMATHGRTGLQRWAFGSVADKLLSGARIPILLVRASDPPHVTASIRRILVPLDGSTLAERALNPAEQMARAFDAEILLLRVHEPSSYGQGGLNAGMSTVVLDDALRVMIEDYLKEKTLEIRNRGVRAGWETKFGIAAESILAVARDRSVNLVVMASHGRSGIGRWIMGSVADRVLRASWIPVLLIRADSELEEA